MIEGVDFQGQRKSLAAQFRQGTDGTEFAQRPGRAEDDAVEQGPFDLRQGDAEENSPAAGSHEGRRFLFIAPVGAEDGDDFPEDEGKGDENRRQDDAGNGKDDLDIRPPVVVEDFDPLTDPAHAAEGHDEGQAGDDRRDGKGYIDEGRQEMLAPEVEFGNSPGRTEADDSIDDDGGDRGDQGQAQGRQDVWRRQGLYVKVPAFGQRVGEDRHEGNDEHDHDEDDADREQGDFRLTVFHNGSPPLLDAPGLMDLDHIDRKQCDKGDDQHGQGDGRGDGVIDVIELLHDDVRNDLRMMLGTVARNVDDAAVFAEAPGKSQAEARQQSRPQFREDDAPENGELRRAEHAARFFIRRVELLQDRLDRADDKRDADEDHGDGQADLGIGDLDAIAGKETSEEARIGIELGKGDAGDSRRQGKGQFDDAVQETFPEEIVADKDPAQDEMLVMKALRMPLLVMSLA